MIMRVLGDVEMQREIEPLETARQRIWRMKVRIIGEKDRLMSCDGKCQGAMHPCTTRRGQAGTMTC